MTLKIGRGLSICAAAIGLLLLVTPGAQAQKSGRVGSHAAKLRVMVMPLDTDNADAAELSDTISSVEVSRLRLTHRFQPSIFTAGLPSIRRAILEGTLTAADTSAPWNDDVKLKKLAAYLTADGALVVALSDYSYDPDKHQVSLIMSARLVTYQGKKPVAKTGAESMSTAAGAVHSPDDVLAVVATARALTDKLMTDVLKPTKPKAAPVK
ncbi:MAG: hypothetical protein KGJ62_03795 [Armatimonadetes bacterium]|nr:hypothetical protein [Armatimonadota bacterium]MDE2205976.1 hypothetical protein [Armatimonadota bacterium]